MKKIISIALILISFSCEKNNQSETVNTENKNVSQLKNEVEKETPKDEITLNHDTIKNYGIKSQIIQKKKYIDTINTTGLIKETENSVYKINSPVQGKVIYDGVKIGDYVRTGQKIASIQNSEVSKIYSEYIHESHSNEIVIKQAQIKLNLAEKTLAREKSLFEQGISSRKDYENANTDFELLKAEIQGLKEHETHLRSEANALLLNYGVTLGSSSSENIISVSPITSPNNGMITQKNITQGTMILSGQEIYQITDLSKVYLNISIQDKDIRKIKLGQNVVFTSDIVDKTFQGVVDNISSNVNPDTQTFTIRSKINNSNGYLKNGSFGKVKISLSVSEPMYFIPAQALQSYNNEKFVFIEPKNDTFKKILINPEKTTKEGFYVTKNIQNSYKVVIDGAFSLKSELLKNEFKEEE